MTGYKFERASVLIVDDSPWMRAILRRMLTTLGFGRIVEAGDGASALEAVARHTPDIVLADWDMKPMDGVELTRRIRRLPEGEARFVPVIMVSAFRTLENVLTARNAGVTEFLVKPVSPRTLYQHLVTVIERPRLFVEAPDYAGPDRRRRDGTDYGGPPRHEPERGGSRHTPPALRTLPGLSQAEISAVMHSGRVGAVAAP